MHLNIFPRLYIHTFSTRPIMKIMFLNTDYEFDPWFLGQDYFLLFLIFEIEFDHLLIVQIIYDLLKMDNIFDIQSLNLLS